MLYVSPIISSSGISSKMIAYKKHICANKMGKCAYAKEKQIGVEHHNSWVLPYNNVHDVMDWLWEQSK